MKTFTAIFALMGALFTASAVAAPAQGFRCTAYTADDHTIEVSSTLSPSGTLSSDVFVVVDGKAFLNFSSPSYFANERVVRIMGRSAKGELDFRFYGPIDPKNYARVLFKSRPTTGVEYEATEVSCFWF